MKNKKLIYNNMRVIGWDIGIKNLAFCIIDEYDGSLDKEYKQIINDNDFNNKELEIFEFNNNKYIILDWGIINIVDKVSENMEDNGELYLSSRPKFKCSMCNVKNKQCSKNATYCKELVTDGKYFGYCNSHFLKSPYSRLPKVDEKKPLCYWSKEIKTNNTDTNISISTDISTNTELNCKPVIQTCSSKATYVRKDNVFIAYCTKHKNEIIKLEQKKEESIIDKDISKDKNISKDEDLFLKIKNVKKSTNINLTLIGQSVFQQLDNKKNLLDTNIVLLENQPVLKNPTMKSIQMFMYSYYIIKGVEDKKKKVNQINCYSANNKTELDAFIDTKEKKKITEQIQNIKDNKGKRKKKAILLTKIILEKCPNWLSFFNDNKKKDDLADSFLMSLHYFNKNKK